jgi:5-methylcytosine-specific restriction endonuclease McrA
MPINNHLTPTDIFVIGVLLLFVGAMIRQKIRNNETLKRTKWRSPSFRTEPLPASDHNNEPEPQRQPTERSLRYQQFLKSDHWKNLRQQTLERDRHRCRICDHDCIQNLEIHHRRYPATFGDETIDDLTTLCRYCHETVSNRNGNRRTSLQMTQ